MMPPLNSPKHQSPPKSKPGVHNEHVIAFDLLLLVWPSVSGKWFTHQVFWRAPRGCLYKYSVASLDKWWVLPPLGASRQWISTPMGTPVPPRVPRALGVQVARWEGDLSLLVFAVRGIPKQSCFCHMSLHKSSQRGSLKATHSPFCPIPC